MLIIESNKLIHTDSMDDVLLHFGTKGATRFAKKNYNKAKYAAGFAAKRSYL
jgi:hypothetical protein